MIGYLDASALVKRYVAEKGSNLLIRAMTAATVIATVTISRAEVAAALAKAARLGSLTTAEARLSHRLFQSEWPDIMRLQVTEQLLDQAEAAAWEHGLRGYDAVHLGAAIRWQEMSDHPVHMMTFDRHLWQSARERGLQAWPDNLPGLIERWNSRTSS